MPVIPNSNSDHGASSGLRYQLRLFFTALQFFTRLPAPRWVGFEVAWLAHATRYLPAVGILVALVCAVVYWLSSLMLPQIVAVLLATAAGIYLTGAFHEDGFTDVCDGFGGSMQVARILDIMRDSRVGAFGVIGVVLAYPLSRGLATVLIWRMDYVREEGKVKPLAQQMSNVEFSVAAVTALLLGVAATIFLAHKFQRRLGGYTGDCLGAVQQLSEVAIYLGLLAAVTHL